MAAISQVVLAGVVAKEPKAGETGFVKRWDLNTGVQLGASQKEYHAEAEGPNTIALLPADLSLLRPAFVALNTKSASLNYYLMGKEMPALRFYGQDRLCSVAPSPNGCWLAAGNEEGKLFLWEVASGEAIAVVEDAHYQRVPVLKFSADGSLLVSASADGTVAVWSTCSLAAGAGTAVLRFSDHTDAVADVHVGFGAGRNCRLLSAGCDGTVQLYDLVDGERLAQFGFPSPVRRVVLTGAETLLLAGCDDGNIYTVDLGAEEVAVQQQRGILHTEGRAEAVLRGHSAAICGLALSLGEGELVSGDADGQVVVWNVSSRQIVRRFAADGAIKWLGVAPKASIELACSGAFRLRVAQPKRAVSAERATASAVRASARPAAERDAPARPSSAAAQDGADQQLRASYTRLLDFVFAQYTHGG